jgi:Ca2+/H+ antiporter, TMEM165/GDT1 family
VSTEAFAVSAGVVALGEMGDKTQLLALLLAARYRKPLPIMAGILLATLANHGLAGALGVLVTRLLDPLLGQTGLRYILAASFVAVGLWMLVPDKADDSAAPRPASSAWAVLGITTVAFFLAEMGDKTQVATVMLAARYNQLLAVTAGTTAGMLLANVPVVLLGERVVKHVPIVWVHRVAALVFVALGVAVAVGTPAS